MTIEELRDEVIRRGREGAIRDYSGPEREHKLRGALNGFARAEKIALMPEQWEAEIAALEEKGNDMRRKQQPEGYWEHRCYQAEIEWVFSVLCIAWKWGKTQSARAGLIYAEIVGVK